MTRHQGFTLVELLVAMAVFAAMSAMAYAGLRTVLDVSAHNEQAAMQFNELQRAFTFLQQDLSQLLARPVRDELGDSEAALAGHDDALRLTRLDALGMTGNPLARVDYRLQDGHLQRRQALVLDRVQGSEFASSNLLSDCKRLGIRFLPPGGSSDWVEEWPLDASAQAIHQLPQAVEVTLDTANWQNVRRVFLVRPE